MGFHKIASYLYTGWHEPASEMQFIINSKKFEKLPADLKEILIVAMRVSAYDMSILKLRYECNILAEMKAEYQTLRAKTFS